MTAVAFDQSISVVIVPGILLGPFPIVGAIKCDVTPCYSGLGLNLAGFFLNDYIFGLVRYLLLPLSVPCQLGAHPIASIQAYGLPATGLELR